MKKICLILCSIACLSSAYGSKLSKYLHKMEERDRAEKAREWQQDMNFSDFVFRLQSRSTNTHGQQCREYVFRSRSNPYRHGHYTVCDDR